MFQRLGGGGGETFNNQKNELFRELIGRRGKSIDPTIRNELFNNMLSDGSYQT